MGLSQPVVQFGRIAVELRRPRQQGDRAGRVAALQDQAAQEIQVPRLIRLLGQNQVILLYRLGQAASPLVADRRIQTCRKISHCPVSVKAPGELGEAPKS